MGRNRTRKRRQQQQPAVALPIAAESGLFEARPFAAPAVAPNVPSFAGNNHSLQRISPTANPTIQTKLTVGPANDPYEQQADQTAATVLTRLNQPSFDPTPRRKRRRKDNPAPLSIQPLGSTAPVQAGPASNQVERSVEAKRGQGRPLEAGARSQMEGAFGHDFSRVKVHTDAESDQLNQSLNSRAFTTGQDIFFSRGEFQPTQTSGQELLAHELTHVVQQTGAAPTAQTARRHPPAQPAQGAIQCARRKRRPKPATALTPEEKAKQAKVRAAIKARQQKEHDEKYGWFGSKTRLGKAKNLATGWLSWGGYDGSHETEGEGGSFQTEQDSESHGDWDSLEKEEQQEEQEEENASILDQLSPKKVEIKLIDADTAQFKKEGALGSLEGSGDLKASLEGLEGSAEIKFEYGDGTTQTQDLADWIVSGQQLKATGTQESFSGFKGEAKVSGKAGYDSEKGYSASAKGKLSAFAGETYDEKVDIVLKSGNQDLLTGQGSLGLAVGLGGEYSWKIKWGEGKLSMGGKGKVVAGVGFSYGYKLTVNTQTIAPKLWTWLVSSGAQLYDFWEFLSEQEPLMI